MEQFNPLDSKSSSTNFTLSPQIIEYIETGSKWAKFLAVLGFISCGFIALAMLFFLLMGVSSDFPIVGEAMATGAIMFIIYGLIFAIYFFTSLYLYRFANSLLTAVRTLDDSSFEEGFLNYKRCFKLIGILSLVMISLYILFIFVGVITTLLL